MMLRSAALVPVLLLAAALSADGDTTVLVADTASAEVTITGEEPDPNRMQFFKFTPAGNESVTFKYADQYDTDSSDHTDLRAYAKRGGCPTTTDFDFSADRYDPNIGLGVTIGEIYIDPCSGSGEICFMVMRWSCSGRNDCDEETAFTVTATVSTALGAMAMEVGNGTSNTLTLAWVDDVNPIRSGVHNFQITLPSDFDPAASKPSTLNPQPSTLNPQPSTLNPQPSTLNPQS